MYYFFLLLNLEVLLRLLLLLMILVENTLRIFNNWTFLKVYRISRETWCQNFIEETAELFQGIAINKALLIDRW